MAQDRETRLAAQAEEHEKTVGAVRAEFDPQGRFLNPYLKSLFG